MATRVLAQSCIRLALVFVSTVVNAYVFPTCGEICCGASWFAWCVPMRLHLEKQRLAYGIVHAGTIDCQVQGNRYLQSKRWSYCFHKGFWFCWIFIAWAIPEKALTSRLGGQRTDICADPCTRRTKTPRHDLY